MLACALTAVLTAASGAHAAFPGKNGRIVFSSDRDSPFSPNFLGREIFTMNPDGSGLVQLTEGEGQSRGDAEPAWSPDGKRIAFIRSDASGGGSGSFVYVMNADGTGVTQVPNTGFNARGVSWSPNGQRLAFANAPGDQCHLIECGYDIWTVRLDGTDLTQLTTTYGEDLDPDWSPDGRRIAFVSDRQTDDALSGLRLLYTMNADGTNQTRITNFATEENHPDWSPDGRRIVFQTDRPPHDGGTKIWTINADGANPVRVTSGRGVVDRVPVWSPDGRRLAFTSTRELDGWRIYTSNPDGTDVTRLTDTHGAFDFDADWQPLPGLRRADYNNASQFCKAEREFLGDAAFAAKYGGASNAHAQCVKQNK